MENLQAQRVGARIKSARELAGLSQVELGNRIGVSGPAISQYESGVREVGLAELNAIARVLKQLPSYFIDEAGVVEDDAVMRALYADKDVAPDIKEHVGHIIEREHEKHRGRQKK